MTPILNSIAEASADAVYFMGGGEKEVGAFFSEAKATPGLEKTAFFVWEGHFNPEFLRIAGENAVGVYVTALRLDFDRQSSAYQAFLSSYRSQYGQEPISQFHAYAYDAASILLKAIEQTAIQQADGSLVVDLQAIRAALFNLKDYPGLTGILTCTPLGECATNGTGNVFQFTGADPDTFNPGPASSLSSNPSQVWP
jgi:branched-chain amino acid transport system substrate-binding protein